MPCISYSLTRECTPGSINIRLLLADPLVNSTRSLSKSGRTNSTTKSKLLRKLDRKEEKERQREEKVKVREEKEKVKEEKEKRKEEMREEKIRKSASFGSLSSIPGTALC